MPFQLRSPAFEDGQPIPRRYTGDGENVSPPLEWTEAPDHTNCLALICEDPDAPRGTFTHWVVFNIPPGDGTLPEGIAASGTLEDGALQGTNDFGKLGYGGPAPPPGKPHRYIFRLCALNRELHLVPGTTKAKLIEAIQDHVLDEAKLTGTYAR